jgi:hypothetical protein
MTWTLVGKISVLMVIAGMIFNIVMVDLIKAWRGEK